MARLLAWLQAALAAPMLALAVAWWLLARVFPRIFPAVGPRPEESAWDELLAAPPGGRLGARLAERGSLPARTAPRPSVRTGLSAPLDAGTGPCGNTFLN